MRKSKKKKRRKRRAKRRRSIKKKEKRTKRRRIRNRRKRIDYNDGMNISKISITPKLRTQIIGPHFSLQPTKINQTSGIPCLYFFFLPSNPLPGLLLFFVESLPESVEILVGEFFVGVGIGSWVLIYPIHPTWISMASSIFSVITYLLRLIVVIERLLYFEIFILHLLYILLNLPDPPSQPVVHFLNAPIVADLVS